MRFDSIRGVHVTTRCDILVNGRYDYLAVVNRGGRDRDGCSSAPCVDLTYLDMMKQKRIGMGARIRRARRLTPPTRESSTGANVMYATGKRLYINNMVVIGDNNDIVGDHNTSMGNWNKLHGKGCRVRGDNNLVAGTDASAAGYGNVTRGPGATNLVVRFNSPLNTSAVRPQQAISPRLAASRSDPIRRLASSGGAAEAPARLMPDRPLVPSLDDKKHHRRRRRVRRRKSGK